MNKPLRRPVKDIVYKLYKYFEARKNDHSSREFANCINLAKTVSQVTGFAETTVKKIIREGRSTEAECSTPSFKSPQKYVNKKKRIEIDSFTECIIRRKVSQWYTVKKQIPSLKKLIGELRAEINFQGSMEYLRVMLRRLGFKFLPSQGRRKLLIERHDIMRQRQNYIHDIKKYRQENRSIIFLDEAYLNESRVAANHFQFETKRGPIKNLEQLVIVHAGTRNGFVKDASLIFESPATRGDQGDMNADVFQKWVEEKLIPNIPQNSVVIMDNAAYHSSQIDKKPTMTTLKTKMQDWLDRRGVNYDNSLRKCDLMKIINEQSTTKQYKVDEILIENGHTVLRLPAFHDDLNPFEYVWKDLKEELATITIDSYLVEMKIDLESIIAKYAPENWSKCDDLVIKNEDEYYESDRVFDDEFDKLVSALKGKDDDDDDSEDDDTEEEEDSDMDTV